MSAQAGIAAAEEFIAAFNAQDHGRLANTLNYPHVRLAAGRFRTIESEDEFEAGSARGESRLRDEGWHHTDIDRIDVVHAGDDKAHIAMTINRCREDGIVYNTFDTFWIATLQDGKWGIQFRSSFLR